jgi:hypothetical protein
MAAFMYTICKEKTGVTFVCLLCSHTERVDAFGSNKGNARTLAAHAMLKHARHVHGREAITGPIPRDHGLTTNFG